MAPCSSSALDMFRPLLGSKTRQMPASTADPAGNLGAHGGSVLRPPSVRPAGNDPGLAAAAARKRVLFAPAMTGVVAGVGVSDS